MSFFEVIILAVVQGLAELLPVSSSAHVIVAERLLGLDPSAPPMTLLLVMLHTGTMFAVIVYFWRQWRSSYFQNSATFQKFAGLVIVATTLTAIVGGSLITIIERTRSRDSTAVEIEDLFSHLELVAAALAVAGVLILIAGRLENRNRSTAKEDDLNTKQALLIGAVQGLSLPFRGFSRSGATISAGMLAGVAKARAESFSFALAVVLTPAVVAREAMRLAHAKHMGGLDSLASATLPSLIGAVLAFFAGLIALKWLSRWLESGRWYLFGVYCLIAAAGVEILHHLGY